MSKVWRSATIVSPDRYSKEACKRRFHRLVIPTFLPDKALTSGQAALGKLKFQNKWRAFVEGNRRQLERATTDDKLRSSNSKSGRSLSRSSFKEVSTEVIARWTGIPSNHQTGKAQKLWKIEAELHRRVISQRAGFRLARAIRRSRRFKNPTNGLSFIFRRDGSRQNGSRPQLAEFSFTRPVGTV